MSTTGKIARPGPRGSDSLPLSAEAADSELTVDSFSPMRALDKSVAPFSDPTWLYEVKWDGYRMTAGFGGGKPVELRTKGKQRCTTWFPEVCEVLGKVAGGPHVVDGEACLLDEHGRSDFNRLRARASRRRYVPGTQVTFMVFDIMVYNGQDVTKLPLVQRKALLKKALAKVGKTTVLYQDHFPADASLFNDWVMRFKLEGFMAKRRLSTYQPGPARSPDWRKVKRSGAVPPGRFKRR